jgi:hypothetical protein
MTLFIALLLIYHMELSSVWMGIATLIWFVHIMANHGSKSS